MSERRAEALHDCFRVAGIRGLEHEVIYVFISSKRSVGRRRDEHLLVVAAAVTRVLVFLQERTDDKEGRLIDGDRFSDRRRGAEDVFGQLVADEDRAPLLRDVDGVDEAPAALRDQVAHRSELGIDAGCVDRKGLRAVFDLHVAGVLGGDGIQPVDVAAGSGEVIGRDADAPPFAESFVRNRGQAGPGDDDAVAEAGRRFDELLVQPRAEGQHQTDGHRPPDDPEDRQEGAQLFSLEVAGELFEDVFHGVAWLLGCWVADVMDWFVANLATQQPSNLPTKSPSAASPRSSVPSSDLRPLRR